MRDDQERTNPRTTDVQRGNPKGDAYEPRGATGMQSAVGGNGTQPAKGLITRSPGATGATGQGVPAGAADQLSNAPPRAKRKKKVVPVEQELLMGSFIRAVAEKEKSRKRKSAWRKVPEPPCDLLVLERAADVEPRPLEWLWPGRIPMGRLTLIAGEPGVGKSLVTLDLVSRVTRGAPWPDDPDRPQRKAGHVLIVAPDDEPRTTIVPRLIRAGARLERTFCASGVYNKHPFPALGSKRGFRLPDDIPSLRKTIVALAPVRLIVLDPVWAFLGGRPEHRITTGPDILAPLADLAAIYNVAIVGVTGMQRQPRSAGIYQAAGYQSLTAARAVWGIVQHPGKSEKRLLLPTKMNLGLPPTGLEFAIENETIVWDEEPATLTAKAVYAAERSGTECTELAGAEQWLRSYLAEGSKPAREVMSQAFECGVSRATLRRAKAAIGVKVQRHGFNGDAHFRWSLAERNKTGAAEMVSTYGI